MSEKRKALFLVRRVDFFIDSLSDIVYRKCGKMVVVASTISNSIFPF